MELYSLICYFSWVPTTPGIEWGTALYIKKTR
jgi:hypothetical protein